MNYLMQIMKLTKIVLGLVWNVTLLEEAYKYIGVDASPGDRADDVLGCAESVTEILKKVRPRTPIILGTWTLNEYFKNTKGYRQVTVPMPGDIVISPTGMGNGKIRGHVGIVGRRGTILSNSSASGKWMSFYTLESWNKRYQKKGGITTTYYSLI